MTPNVLACGARPVNLSVLFKKIVTRELLNIFFSGKQLSIIELLIYDMEIVSVQRKNFLCLLFRFIKVYTKRISWRAIPWFGPPGDAGRSSKLSVNVS